MSAGLEWALGLRVEIATILDTVVVGIVYAYDPITMTLTLIEDNKDGKTPSQSAGGDDNIRILKLAFIRHVTVLGQPTTCTAGSTTPSTTSTRTPFEQTPTIGPISLSSLTKTEAASIKEERQRLLTRGPVGIPMDVQRIFDGVAKTLPARWYERSIIVMDEVRIDPPYSVQDCMADDENSSALRLVKMIVEGTWKKIEENTKGG